MGFNEIASPQSEERARINAVSFGELYPELRRLARRERYRVGQPITLQTTVLIHEVWFKLGDKTAWNDQPHFLRTAALAMRHVLIDAARARLRLKRDVILEHITISDKMLADKTMPDETLIALSSAVQRLSAFDERLASVVECRFFAGYTDAEIANALGVNERTVRRDWTKAKAWLYRDLTT